MSLSGTPQINGPANSQTVNSISNPTAAPSTTPAPAPIPASPPASSVTATPGAISTVAGQLPGTTLTADQMSAITNTNIQNATNPQLSAAETATPINQQAQAGELLNQAPQIPVGSNTINPATGTIAASTVNGAATVAQPGQITAATYNANQVDPATLGNMTQAVTAALPAGALVSNQLQALLTPDANGNLPSWVQPAVTAANQFLAGRGISNSTMAGQAITTAILTAAMPVATANANAVQSAWSQNLSNEQAAAMQNGQAMVQAALSNQGAQNAAANFNATSENQTNQFVASLATQVNQFNAAQTNSINTFNAQQTQTAATASASLTAQLNQFNANMANQQSQFNIQNALIVQQSNAEYLRQVNTANTAVQNQDNQLNAQNAMNLSTQAMANLQTEFNDNATMLYNSNMTAEQQSFAMTYLSQQFGLQGQLNSNLISQEQQLYDFQQIGTLASNLFSPLASGVGSAISGLFSGTGTIPTSTDTGSTSTGGGGGGTAGTVTNNIDPNSLSSNTGGSGSGSSFFGSAVNTVSDIGSSLSDAAGSVADYITSLFG